jgi:hypothetical protein
LYPKQGRPSTVPEELLGLIENYCEEGRGAYSASAVQKHIVERTGLTLGLGAIRRALKSKLSMSFRRMSKVSLNMNSMRCKKLR